MNHLKNDFTLESWSLSVYDHGYRCELVYFTIMRTLPPAYAFHHFSHHLSPFFTVSLALILLRSQIWLPPLKAFAHPPATDSRQLSFSSSETPSPLSHPSYHVSNGNSHRFIVGKLWTLCILPLGVLNARSLWCEIAGTNTGCILSASIQ